MTARLGRLVVEGLRSIRRMELELTTDVTVLIGANGSGKSSLMSALELVARIWDDSFQDYLRECDGVDRLLFADRAGTADRILIELMLEPDAEGNRSGYSARLRPSPPGDSEPAWLQERHLIQTGRSRDSIHSEVLYEGPHSPIHLLTQSEASGRLHDLAVHLRPLLEGCRVFHFHNTSAAQGWSTVGDDTALRANAENIAAYLLKVRQEHPEHYQRIVAAIRQAAPFFDDFVLAPGASEQVRLWWRQRGAERILMAHETSDGTLRFICLAALLLGPSLPATVVLDEPELGLHPTAIGLLAEMTHAVGRNGHRVIMATQSAPLLSHYELDEVLVLDRVDGATAVSRPDAKVLKAFVEDCSTGTLWEMNLLGGRPAHEGAVL